MYVRSLGDFDLLGWMTGNRVTDRSARAESRDFFDPNVSWGEWWRANFWGQPVADHGVYRPQGPLVPDGALTGSKTPYSDQYVWCQATDADCLNRAAQAEVQNKRDAKRNVENDTQGIMDAAARSLDPPDEESTEGSGLMILLLGAAVLVAVAKR